LITLEDVKKNKTVSALITKSDDVLNEIGYTEHGERHCSLAANIAYNVMTRLGKGERKGQLAAIAGYMHDMGNIINRDYHAQTASVIAFEILKDMGMDIEDICDVITAIGNHDERDGYPVSDISAAVILADKSDVHRSRVRKADTISVDIHDRVNYAAEASFLKIIEEEKLAQLEIKIDTSISQVMEYFEIFLSRMLVCKRAAEYLGLNFALVINDNKLL
jgi:metal-dependent HD superfamily phosphatase/phosphodiesterase